MKGKDISLNQKQEMETLGDGLFKSIFRAMGRDYLHICLIDIESRMVKTLKGGQFSSKQADISELQFCPYDEMCERAIRKRIA